MLEKLPSCLYQGCPGRWHFLIYSGQARTDTCPTPLPGENQGVYEGLWKESKHTCTQTASHGVVPHFVPNTLTSGHISSKMLINVKARQLKL